jgi:hypothetical protein
MIRSVLHALRRARNNFDLPRVAKAEARRDNRLGLSADPGAEAVIAAAAKWICVAQDRSLSNDGGVARHFSLISGWAASYPETTGYIIPTMFSCEAHLNRPDLADRAKRMTRWLVSIQFPEGGFQGGVIGQTPVVPVTFNTGQILLGLSAAVVRYGEEFRDSTMRAADWLKNSQDPDGCWRQHPTPFAEPGEKAYETHVAWGLFEAERVIPGRGYAEAGYRNVRWAMTRQRHNGWFDACCLSDASRPLTHTIGYVLRGVIEAHRLSLDPQYLSSAIRTASGILSALEPNGRLPGRLDKDWKSAASWVCLTGSAQIAFCLLYLYGVTMDNRYREAAFALNSYVRRTIKLDAIEDERGAVKGSFPVNGDYGRFEYLNWAAKFTIDSNLAELALQGRAAN